ncbi:hypothetical protein G4B88_003347 [Cannabis sativa]|uniref:Uncharacterized protein n=1 Tax=Cannabis sativa TaxID=3483 RepID=A0A7J6DM48_CANSA|nr:hypothetical protein G4B88_003347 [Cannabis sativa]
MVGSSAGVLRLQQSRKLRFLPQKYSDDG